MKEYQQVNTWGLRLCYVAVKSDSPSEDIPDCSSTWNHITFALIK